jgi:predicted AlkP superfamily phosphohydrolase/phosphomutase
VTRPRLVVVGLDCAPPSIVFDRYRAAMPTVARAMGRGTWGPLRSTVPPITVPAWASMTSGRDPGELGLYGFRNRATRGYAVTTSTSADVRVERLWDLVERAGRRAAALYVPPTWPPPQTSATIVSCMLTPGPDAVHTRPIELAEELRARFGPHAPDLDDDGTLAPDAVLEGLHAIARQHFDVAEHVLATRDPDFLMVVELATDRLHHALWPAMDPSDPRHDPASPHGRGARDLYRYLDARIERLMEKAGPGATLLVVSDHGARPLLGGVRVNELLRRAGWLVLKNAPGAPTDGLDHAHVDWARTRAWSEGGYYARVFLNVRGREPEGALDPSELGAATRELATLLGRIEEGGVVIESRIERPETAYREAKGVPPDLLCFFGDLTHRSLGGVGHASVLATIDEVENDRGRGGANHDWDGIFVLAGPEIEARGRIEGASILDIAPTCLRLLGLEVPRELRGVDLRTRASR